MNLFLYTYSFYIYIPHTFHKPNCINIQLMHNYALAYLSETGQILWLKRKFIFI